MKCNLKKENIPVFLYVISALLILGFCIRVGVDYIYYDTYNNSAPFYVFILERVFEFLIPSFIILIFAKVMKKKYNKQ